MNFSLTARRERIIVEAILLLAVILRVIAAIVIPDQSSLLPYAIAYRDSAAQLLKHWQMTNPYQMPLYPLLIAVTGPGIGQLTADIALSVISVWLVSSLTQELFADQCATIFSGAAAACYPPLIFSQLLVFQRPCISRSYWQPSCIGTALTSR
jgi:hypothetical protein